MKTVKYVPSVCKGENPSFEGSVTLRMPTFDERMDYLESLTEGDFEIDESGKMNRVKSQNMKSIRQMVKNSQKHYQAVEIKNKSTGEEYKSFEDLTSDGETHLILIEVASFIIQGAKMGNA